MAIEVRLTQLILKRQYEWGRDITYSEIAEGTGLAESTIARLKSDRSKGIRFDVLDALCTFFDCQVGDILVHAPDDEEDDE